MRENRLIHLALQDLAARRRAERLGTSVPAPVAPVAPPTRLSGTSSSPSPSDYTRYNPRGAVSNAANVGTVDPNRGIRPGQFGEIDEAAGERVVIDKETGAATVQDPQGNVIRGVGSVTSPFQRTVRQDAGAPLQDPRSSAGGRQGGELGFNPAGSFAQDPNALGGFKRMSEQEAVRIAEDELRRMGIADPILIRQAKNDAREGIRIQGQIDTDRQIEEERKADKRAIASSMGAKTTDPVKAEPGVDTAFAAMIAATTDPKDKAILMAIQAENDLRKTEETKSRQEFYDSEGKVIGESYDKAEDRIDKIGARIENMSKAMNAVLEKTFNDQTKYNAKKEAQINNQLQWNQDKLVREQADFNQKELNRMTASLALRGGFGSSSGLLQVTEARRAGEQALVDIKTEFGFKRADVSLEFTKMTNDAFNNYRLNTVKNTDIFQTRLEAIDMQGIANQQAKGAAIESGWKDYIKGQEDELKEQAALLTKATEFVSTAHKEEGKIKADTDKEAFDRLVKTFEKFPAGSPQRMWAVQYAKDNGIDTTDWDPSQMTIAEVNEANRNAQDAQSASGRKPLAKQVQDIRDMDDALAMLLTLEKDLKTFEGVGGPIAGMSGIGDIDPGVFASMNKFNADVVTGFGVPYVADAFETQREATAKFNLVKQVIGKGLEGGVLRKEDEFKYAAILPTLRDTDRTRAKKLEQVKHLINTKKQNQLRSMQQGGFDVSGYNSGEDPMDLLDDWQEESINNDDATDLLQQVEMGGDLHSSSPTKFLNTLAMAHVKHEGYGTPNAQTITAGNNPGALRWHPAQAQFGGQKGPKNFTVFPDVDSGYRALMADLRAKVTGNSAHIDYSNNPTLLDYISVYAPAGDNNNPTAYSNAVIADLRRAGYDVDLNTPLTQLSSYIA